MAPEDVLSTIPAVSNINQENKPTEENVISQKVLLDLETKNEQTKNIVQSHVSCFCERIL